MPDDPFEPSSPPTVFQKTMDAVVVYWPVALIGGLIIWYIIEARSS